MVNKTFRTGIGFDVHRLAAGRALVLGGVAIPFEKGLEGWSDADVLLHAVMDALLGAAALGDIGENFPPGDPEYHNISSLILLSRVSEKLARAGWVVGNIDATVIAEKPKLSPFFPLMKNKIAITLKISPEQISIKATTSEGLGFTGEGKGIAAYAAALLQSKGI